MIGQPREQSVPGEAVVATLDGEPLRAAFPMRATVFGVAAVVIPEAEFRRLVRAATEARREARRRRAPSPSKLDEQDPEVAAFVRERLLAGATISATETAARSTFGRDRAPSWNAIQRFRLKVIQEKAPAEPAASIA